MTTETPQMKSPYQICNQSVSLQYTKNCINLPAIINATNRRDKISSSIDSEVKYEKYVVSNVGEGCVIPLPYVPFKRNFRLHFSDRSSNNFDAIWFFDQKSDRKS